MNERLYRSRDERIIGGVCGGLAERFDLDPSLVRVGWALLTIVSGGVFLIIYAVMLFVVPEGPEGGIPRPVGSAAPPGPGAVAGWQAPTAADGPVIGPAATAASQGSPETGPEAMSAVGETGAASEPGSAAWSTPTPPPTSVRTGGNDSAAGLIIGLLLILGGGFLLLQQFVPAFDLDRFWPVAIIAIGVVLLLLALRPRRRD